MHEYGVITLWTGRQQGDRRFNKLLNAAHIFYCLRRQLSPRARAAGCFLPTRKALVNRFDARLRRLRRWQSVNALAIEQIMRANIDLIKAVENIKLRQGDAVYARSFDGLAR